MSDSNMTKEAVTCAIRHIGTGIYSSGKIRLYLMQRGYSEAVASEAVKLLIESGYIDDLRASRKVLAVRSGKKQESKQFMYQRLLEAGIDPEYADLVVDELGHLGIVLLQHQSQHALLLQCQTLRLLLLQCESLFCHCR